MSKRMKQAVACERGELETMCARLADLPIGKGCENPERLTIILSRLDWLMEADGVEELEFTFAQLKSRLLQWLTVKQIEHAVYQLRDLGLLIMRKTEHGVAYSFPPSGETISPQRGEGSPPSGETPISNVNEHLNKHLNEQSPKVVRQKKAKEPQEPALIKLAEKIHGYITRKMKEHNLLPGALKFDVEVTANILRQLRDIDKIPQEMIGTVLAWTWSYEFDNGTIYGSVLTSPAQWRNRKPGASTNKFQNAYASWLRETGGQGG